MPITHKCKICGIDVKRSPSKKRKNYFCSPEHFLEWQRSKEGREHYRIQGLASMVEQRQLVEGLMKLN